MTCDTREVNTRLARIGGEMTSVLVKAIQELKAELDALKGAA